MVILLRGTTLGEGTSLQSTEPLGIEGIPEVDPKAKDEAPGAVF